MSIKQARELICDCRHLLCKLGGADRCDYAITDYASTHAAIREIGAHQGWTVTNLGAWNQRDLCPYCSAGRHGRS